MSPFGNRSKTCIIRGLLVAALFLAASAPASDTVTLIHAGELLAGKTVAAMAVEADIVAVNRFPLENIEALLDVDFVMKGGKMYKP